MFKNRYVLTKKMCWEWAFIFANQNGILFFMISYPVFDRIATSVLVHFNIIPEIALSGYHRVPASFLIVVIPFLLIFFKYKKVLFTSFANGFASNLQLTYCVSLGQSLTITLESTMKSVSYDIKSVKRCIQTRKYLLLLIAENYSMLLRKDGFVNCSEDEFFQRLLEGGSAVKRTSVAKIALWAVLFAFVGSITVLLLEYLPH